MATGTGSTSPDAAVRLPVTAEVTSALFAPDGRTLITAHEDGYVYAWDVATLAKRRRADGLALRPGGTFEAAAVKFGQHGLVGDLLGLDVADTRFGHWAAFRHIG